MDFSQWITLISTASTVIGFGTGLLTARQRLRKVFNRRQASLYEEIDGLEAQLKTLKARLRLLERENEASLPAALERHKLELRDGNDAQAIIVLEEWLASQGPQLRSLALILANHYVSYVEPHLIRDALSKAQRAISLAALT